jgi:glycosyltransferase involved in cell wall biosynthesis
MNASPSPKRIVLVAMVDSIHVARWISQFPASYYKFYVFPSTPNRRIHPDISRMKSDQGNIEIYPFGGLLSLPLWGMDLIFGNRIRSAFLQALIRRVKPEFVHALEFQHGAYLADQALRAGNLKETFIATNYGSDIYWFQQFPKHLAKIKSVLERADRYSAECERDVQLALGYGFKGQVLPVIPNAGGIPEKYAQMEVLPPSERKLIMIKGYDGWVGRATLAVKALPLIKDQLAGYGIIFYSCNGKTLRAIRKMNRESGIKVTAYPKKKLSHSQMMEMFSRALIYVGVSLSDGISTSMLEALAMGAYPVQTNTACTSEWFKPGAGGIELKEIESAELALAITNALGIAENRMFSLLQESVAVTRSKADEMAIASRATKYYSIGTASA